MLSPLYGQLSPLRIPTSIPLDSDALAYIAAVEAADGQSLEDTVKNAYLAFIVGCKSDGIWGAIKASCILAGARTLSGALVPLVGTAPTNFNFVSGDYTRMSGLKGNGTTKYLRTNRLGTADPKDNFHQSVFVSESPTNTQQRTYIGYTGSATDRSILDSNTNGSLGVYSRTSLGTDISSQGFTTGFKGHSRSASLNYILRSGGNNNLLTRTSGTPSASQTLLFWRSGTLYSNSRLPYYSIGESINLALLDTRVSNLMTALAAAIP